MPKRVLRVKASQLGQSPKTDKPKKTTPKKAEKKYEATVPFASAFEAAAQGKKGAKKEKRLRRDEEDEEVPDLVPGDEEDGDFDDFLDEELEEGEEGELELEDDDDEEEEYLTFEDKAAKFHQRMMNQQRLDDKENLEEDLARGQRPAEVALEEEDGNIEDVRHRITETVRVLKNFKDEREEGTERTEYLAILKRDLIRLYDYNDFLMTQFFEMLPPEEVVELVEANERDRPLTLRVNTLKTKRRELAQSLAARGMHVQALEKWSNVGLQVFDSKVAVGATLEYLAGHYMVQSAVSFLPVIALDPQPNEKVLDLAAAPGGKTTYICGMMKNTGVVFANDVSPARSKALFANIQRMGCNHVVMTCLDGRKYSKMYANFFDRILLDAPCSGTGVIARDKSVKANKSVDDIRYCTQMQKALILNAIDCCKVGGTVVYSTCSVLVAENEGVADYALRKRGVKLVDTGLMFGRPGFEKVREHRFHPDVTKTRRYFPHLHNMDGFYVAKFLKVDDRKITKDNPTGAKPKVPKTKEQIEAAKKKKLKKKLSGEPAKQRPVDAEGKQVLPPKKRRKTQKGKTNGSS